MFTHLKLCLSNLRGLVKLKNHKIRESSEAGGWVKPLVEFFFVHVSKIKYDGGGWLLVNYLRGLVKLKNPKIRESSEAGGWVKPLVEFFFVHVSKIRYDGGG